MSLRAFISVDLEGVGAVSSWQELEQDRERCQWLMTSEANAAVEGALAAGADQVTVVDAHAGGRNLLPEKLHPKARLVRGALRRLFMVAGVEAGFEVALFVGYHARAGEARAAMDHSFHPAALRALRLDGRTAGELALNAAVCAHFGVPVGLASGDAALCEEAREWLPWARAVKTKDALSRFSVLGDHPTLARDRIRAEAEAAVREHASLPRLELGKPLDVELDFMNTAQADLAALCPDAERRGGRTVGFSAPDPVHACALAMALCALARQAE